jgi:hypothetical protein
MMLLQHSQKKCLVSCNILDIKCQLRLQCSLTSRSRLLLHHNTHLVKESLRKQRGNKVEITMLRIKRTISSDVRLFAKK